MTALELKKLTVEYKRVNQAREELELRVMERMEEIQRIEASVEISKAKEQELLAKIAEAQGQQG